MSADSLLTVINDILDFSRSRRAGSILETDDFNLRDCLEAALENTQVRSDERGWSCFAKIAADVRRL